MLGGEYLKYNRCSRQSQHFEQMYVQARKAKNIHKESQIVKMSTWKAVLKEGMLDGFVLWEVFLAGKRSLNLQWKIRENPGQFGDALD